MAVGERSVQFACDLRAGDLVVISFVIRWLNGGYIGYKADVANKGFHI